MTPLGLIITGIIGLISPKAYFGVIVAYGVIKFIFMTLPQKRDM